MSSNNHIINSFVAGEIAPDAMGRTETVQYSQGLEKTFNVIVHPQGGFSRRPGTHFVKQIFDSDGTTTPEYAACFPFHAADGTVWQLVLTSSAPDIPGGYTPGTSTTALNWFAVNTLTYEVSYIMGDFPHPIVNPWWFDDYYEDFVTPLTPIHYAQSGDMMMLTNGVHRPLRIYYEPDVTVNTPKFYITPYPDFWDSTVSNVEAFRQMPFEAPVVQSAGNDLAINLAVDGGGALTISPGAGSLVTFDAGWHGKYIKFTRGAAVCVVMVYDVDSSSSAKVVQIGGTAPGLGTNLDYGGATAANFYEEGYWDENKGWPRTVTFFNRRLVFGGSDEWPDTVWFSEQDDFDELDVLGLVTDAGYGGATVATDQYAITLQAEVLNKVTWMSPGKTIALGTTGREFVVRGPDTTQNIGPTNTAQDAETPHGGAYVQAARIENTTAFLQRDFRTVRELVFNLAEDSFKAEDLNILAPHMGKKWRAAAASYIDPTVTPKGYFVQMAMQQVPNGILWVLNNTGALCGLTRERTQQVNAWHYHELAGNPFTVDSVDYPPFVQAISVSQYEASNPDRNPRHDELWMVVVRGDGSGDGMLFLEKMGQDWDHSAIDYAWTADAEPKKAPVYMDCAFITDAVTQRLAPYSSAQGVISGLPHGDGVEVSVVVNGSYIGEFTIAVDEIDISDSIPDLLNAAQADDRWEAIVGFNYSAYAVPVPPEVPTVKGSSMGQLKRIDQVAIHFVDTIGASFGRYADEDEENTPPNDLEEIVFEPGTDVNDPIPMFTGMKRVVFPEGYQDRPRIKIQSDTPLPMHVTHIVARMNVSEG